MKPFTISEYYTEWAETFRAMFPGGTRPAEQTPRQAQVAANEEWEHEGGSLKPDTPPSSPRP